MSDTTEPSTMLGPTAERRLPWGSGPLWRSWRVAGVLLVVLGGAGCSLEGLLNSDELPRNVTDPAITETPQGARFAYVGTLARFRAAFGGNGNFVHQTGILSDELMRFANNAVFPSLDRRELTTSLFGIHTSYSGLQKVRGQASQAIGLLTSYLPEDPWRAGHLYALQGYAELFLAELYCSGIPLSTLDYGGDFTYRPGSTTDEVLAHAAALFDIALASAGDSARFVHLAQVGRARALMGAGAYAAAAAAVASVPDGYRYDVFYTDAIGVDSAAQDRNFARLSFGGSAQPWSFTVPDREGFNGMDWRSSDDPRTRADSVGTNTSRPIHYPNKYNTLGSSPIVLASGVEARLIEAEAALQANPDDGQWLAKLNALRTNGTFEVIDSQAVTDTTVDSTTTPPDTTIDTTSWTYDTLWHAGSGGVDGLAPLEDPGMADGRVDLLFRERAFWLFLTGQRQGDLRRLIRQYGRTQDAVYPVGLHPFEGLPYGPDVTLPVPETEFLNPLYTGCISRGA